MKYKAIKRVGNWLLDVCCPPKCISCQKILEKGEEVICGQCGPLVLWTEEGCRQTGDHFGSCISPLYYTETIKPSFHRYKFQGHWHYSWTYGRWIWEYLQIYEPEYRRFDLITWAPLSFWRRQHRGYDQARRLALAVSKASGIPLKRTLVKKRHTPPQSGTAKASQRWENVRGAYGPAPETEVRGKRILLVDDVITTGATLEEASAVLSAQGAEEICCLTLARSLLRRGREAERKTKFVKSVNDNRS